MQCMCKHLFKAKDAQKVDGPTPTQNAATLESNRGFYLEDEETSEGPESSLSSEQLDGFLNKLKKSRENLSEGDQNAETPAPRVMISTAEIEVGESRAQKPKSPSPTESTDANLLLESTSLDSIETMAPLPNRESKIQRVSNANPRESRSKPVPQASLWEKFLDLDFSKQLGIVASIAIPLTALIVWMTKEEVKQEVMDPRVQQLLTPNSATGERSRTSNSEEPSQKPINLSKNTEATPEAVRQKAATKPPPPPATPTPSTNPSDNSLFQNMLADTYQGNFENVVRAGAGKVKTLSDEELALYFEALLARAGRNYERIQQIRADIESSRPRAAMPSSIMRAQLVALMRDPRATNNLKRVLETFESLSLTRSRDPLVFAYWGMAYERLERLDLAHKIWDQALTLQPKLAWLIERRLQIYESKDDKKNAIQMATQLSRISGFELAGYSKLGLFYEQAGQKDLAEKSYRMALRYEENPQLRITLADRFVGSPQESIRELQIALSKAEEPKIKAAILMRLGKNFCEVNDTESGLKYLRTAIKENPTSSEAYFQRGLCERKMKLEAKASESFEAALKYSQKDYRLWYYYGLSLNGQGKSRAAIAALTRSLQLQPSEAAHILIAEALKSQSKKQEALVHAKKALQLNPESKRARLLLSELQKP